MHSETVKLIGLSECFLLVNLLVNKAWYVNWEILYLEM